MTRRKLSHYQILDKIGAGGMGEIYVAHDTKLGRRVALKILPAELASSIRRRRFEQEAKAVAALNHPNIVTVYSFEEADGVHFITMELVCGKTLTEIIPARGLPLKEFYDIAIPLADAVSAAHERGIVHRDLKPDNLMRDEAGRLKILDFGLAKWKQEVSSVTAEMDALSDESAGEKSVTREGRIVGTMAYMSPEQAAGRAIDTRSDIFSLGIVLYEMATGRRPFQGDTPVSLASSIIKDPAPLVTELNPSIPSMLVRLIRRCLDKDPERRYQTAKDIRNELQDLHQPGSISGDRVALWPKNVVPRSIELVRRGAQWLSRATWRGRLGVLGAVVALVGLAWALWLVASLASRPTPGKLEPSEQTMLWGRRVLLRWQAPPELAGARTFEVEIRQGDRVERYAAHRSQYPFFPLQENFAQGQFRWRVRSTEPPSNWSELSRATFFIDRVSKIQTEGVIRVGSFADELPPFTYASRASPGGVDGIDVRVARLVARELAELADWPRDLRVTFERSEWLQGNVDDLKSGRADIVFANVGRTQEREERYKIRFSEPYVTSGLAFVWRPSRSVAGWPDLIGRRVATWEDSTAAIVVRAFGGTPANYGSTSQLYEALGSGDVDAILDDEHIMLCEVRSAEHFDYEIEVFEASAGVDLPFTYPDEIAAYVLDDGAGASLLRHVNDVLARPEIRNEIQTMMRSFLDSPDCKAPLEPTHDQTAP